MKMLMMPDITESMSNSNKSHGKSMLDKFSVSCGPHLYGQSHLVET